MLYHLLYPLHTQFTVLNVTRYITFRTAAASLTALVIGLFVGPVVLAVAFTLLTAWMSEREPVSEVRTG